MNIFIDNLKQLYNNIGIIVTSLIFITTFILTHFKNKKALEIKGKENLRNDEKKIKEIMLKFEGIEEIAENIKDLEHEKLIEQKKLVKENVEMVCDKFLEAYCVLLDIEKDSELYVNHSYYFMEAIKEKSLDLFIEVVECNHIADRFERDWEVYKANKLEYILNSTMKHGRKVFRADKMGMTYEEIFIICNQKTIEIFQKEVPKVFELLRDVAIKYRKKIAIQKDILKRMKENTFNGISYEKI